jgi:hypothetical protein
MSLIFFKAQKSGHAVYCTVNTARAKKNRQHISHTILVTCTFFLFLTTANNNFSIVLVILSPYYTSKKNCTVYLQTVFPT